jgi:hypothetical protein
MNVTYSRTFPHRGEMLTARISDDDGIHAAEITSTTRDTGTAVLWSRIFRTESVATMTAVVVAQFDQFVACRLPQA